MADLDDAYANAPYIPDAESYPPRWTGEAEAFRANLGARAALDLPYGPSERQAYDMFLPDGDAQGTLIFVHGGYWRTFDRKTWSHFAKGALAKGWAVAMPSYNLCPHVRIATITQEIALAVQEIASKTDGPISLAGHSAGGHLVARMLAPGMMPGDVTVRLSHVMPISPLSDLEPLVQTAMNADFRMDQAMARAESPLLQPAPDVAVTVWVGGAERPVFLDQAMWLGQAWACAHVVAKDKHHFDVIDDLTDEKSAMITTLTAPA